MTDTKSKSKIVKSSCVPATATVCERENKRKNYKKQRLNILIKSFSSDFKYSVNRS